MIPFNVAPCTGDELKYIEDAVSTHRICGDGKYTGLCQKWMEERFSAGRVLLTTSGTSALDMAMLLCGIQPGDEVILPSYTFSSTATSAVLAGARLVFVDIRPDTMNIDETKIEEAVTEKTRAVIAVHYAGVACEMDSIMGIARKHNLKVVEDAAQGFMSTYKGKYLGTIGDFGCFSFHSTKNYSMGEGGAIVIQNEEDILRAEILREKGTDRSRFFRGEVDKYTWVDFGDSYLPSELNAAYLWPQLLRAGQINENRREIWNRYHSGLSGLEENGLIDRPFVPEGCVHNSHMYYIKCAGLETRTRYLSYMKGKGIGCVFHYVPLHNSPAGLKYGHFCGRDVYTTKESSRLIRLPIYYNMDGQDVNMVIEETVRFFMGN